MKKVFWVLVTVIMAYALPILVAYAVTHVAYVCFGFVLLVLSLLIFLIGSIDDGWVLDRLLLSSTIMFVVGVVMTLLVVIFPNPYIIFLSIVQFFVGWIVCGIQFNVR